jgi:ABC-type Na+ efflux pump permease subunit
MPRGYILRALVYKEFLRLRYNWGLLVLVAVVLVLAGLSSLSARMTGSMFGGGSESVSECIIKHAPSSKWGAYLAGRLSSAPQSVTISFESFSSSFPEEQNVPPDACLIILMDSKSALSPADLARLRQLPYPEYRPNESWRIYYKYPEQATLKVLPIREWVVDQTRQFLKPQPAIEEERFEHELDAFRRIDPVPLVVTALVIFSLYLLCFNIYITSTGEEREKRQLLALFLSPATPLELVLAKILFYGSAGVVMALAVVTTYKPHVLANPLLWTTLAFGAVGYVSLGSIVVTLVRRQATINTVAMLYLVGTTIVFVLGQYLPVFHVLSQLQFELYLNRQLQWIVSEGVFRSSPILQVALAVLSIGWMVVAVSVFARGRAPIAQRR